MKPPETLTADQRELYEQIMRNWRPGDAVGSLLLAEDVPAEDRAAVADAFTPGAGMDYR